MEEEIRRLLRRRQYDAALERLLDLHQKRVFRMAVMMLRNPALAEDVTQDIFLKLWRALPLYDGRAALSTWLYTIARNTCLSAVRAQSLRATDPLVDCAAENTRDCSADSGLERCLTLLPAIQREVITLFYLEDKSVREVAALLDLPDGTVKSHLHRARRALCGMLEK
jgi:RNA polymerase sigma-70 factor (ECF subfamily)